MALHSEPAKICEIRPKSPNFGLALAGGDWRGWPRWPRSSWGRDQPGSTTPAGCRNGGTFSASGCPGVWFMSMSRGHRWSQDGRSSRMIHGWEQWLVAGLEREFCFSIQLGMSSSQLTFSPSFSEGLVETTNQMISSTYWCLVWNGWDWGLLGWFLIAMKWIPENSLSTSKSMIACCLSRTACEPCASVRSCWKIARSLRLSRRTQLLNRSWLVSPRNETLEVSARYHPWNGTKIDR
jgi:hypothetical protein